MKELSEKVCGIPLSAALKLDLKAKELQAEGKSIINFSVGEPPEAVPVFVCDAAAAAIAAGKMKYTNASGLTELKQAVVDSYKKRFGIEYSVKECVITTGAKYAVYAALSALVNPGDEVIVPAPYWTSYYQIVKLAGAEPVVVYGEKENAFKLTPQNLRNAVTDKTKAVILNNPNNPSGAVYSGDELEALAFEFMNSDLYVIADEIYDRLVYTDEVFVSAASISDDMKRRTVTINGVSKAYAMTGMRIGWMLANEKICAAAASMLSHSTGSPNTIAQLAALEAVNKGDEYADELCGIYKKKSQIISEGLACLKDIFFVKPQGAFYVMLCLEGKLLEKYKDGEAFAMALLEKAGVASVPCGQFGNKNAVRISFSVPEEELKEGIKRIVRFVNENE